MEMFKCRVTKDFGTNMNFGKGEIREFTKSEIDKFGACLNLVNSINSTDDSLDKSCKTGYNKNRRKNK